MKHHIRLALAGLLSAVSLTVTACGSAGGDAGGANDGAAEGGRNDGMGAMNQSKTHQAAGGMAAGMLTENGRYSDKRFIDAMVPHHRGAVEMAEVALDNAEHGEIRELSENIIASQEAEIKDLKDIKQEEFGTSRIPMNMGGDQMKGMATDTQSLADEKPFDKAFIDDMLPHHRSAIQMAEVARDKSRNPRVEELATNIVEAQEREISQMKQWRERWYPQG